ncbi:MAG: peptidase MA family metallohydrolase [Pseudomonadota bacterium]
MPPGPSIEKISLFLMAALLLFFVDPAYTVESSVIEDAEVMIHFDEPLRGAAEETIAFFSKIRRDLEKSSGFEMTFRPWVILVRKREVFQKMAGHDLLVAFAIPGRNIVVIDHSKMRTDPFSLERILKHELSHLLLHHHIRMENLPKWLDEGIAQWVSGGLSELLTEQKDSLLHEAILSGKPLSIRRLTRQFPQEKKSLSLAYEESKSLVEYIIDQFGVEGIRKILKGLRDGREIDDAIWNSLSISLDDLERGWLHSLERRMNWPVYLINHLYEILFFLGALILCYAFIRRIIQKNASSEFEEEE